MDDELLDCIVIGGGPAGLTAALYLARFHRRFALIDAGDSRAERIPKSHNLPMFQEGIAGAELLDLQRAHLARYGVDVTRGEVTRLVKEGAGFTVDLSIPAGEGRSLRSHRVILATGSRDVEPNLPNIPDAVRRGLVRYCPICDGYEASEKRLAVIGAEDRGFGEALFIARTYSRDVTLLSLDAPINLNAERLRELATQGVRFISRPVETLEVLDGRVRVVIEGAEHSFDAVYSALGLRRRSELALSLGAAVDDSGALVVDEHQETSIAGLYAVGGTVRGLDQIVVAMGEGAVAATRVHNKCEAPTDKCGDTIPARR